MRYLIILLTVLGIVSLSTCEQSSSPPSTETTTDSNEIYLQKGKNIATATFAILSSNLQKAMKEGGVSNAVNFCNLNATPLVDSLSKVHDATIRRTSLKVRNPQNKPTDRELKQLQVYQESSKAGEELTPTIQDIDNQTIAFYAPIHVMPLCQKCHGKVGETLLEEDYSIIQSHYPNDQAIGYSNEDLRGMWSISFKK